MILEDKISERNSFNDIFAHAALSVLKGLPVLLLTNSYSHTSAEKCPWSLKYFRLPNHTAWRDVVLRKEMGHNKKIILSSYFLIIRIIICEFEMLPDPEPELSPASVSQIFFSFHFMHVFIILHCYGSLRSFRSGIMS